MAFHRLQRLQRAQIELYLCVYIFLCKCIFVTCTRVNKQSPRSQSTKFIVQYACVATCCLQEPQHYFDTVINPCQVQGYENLYGRCVLLPIIRFVTFIFQPNIAAISPPPSLSNTTIRPKKEKLNLGRELAVVINYRLQQFFFSKHMDPILSKSQPRSKSWRIWSRKCEIWCDSASYFVMSFQAPCCVIITIVDRIWLRSQFGLHEFNK